jgi:hypothetical protein
MGNSTIEANSIIDARPYSSGIFVHNNAPASMTVRSNCLENVKPLAIVNGRATVTGNKINPSGGCSIPSGVPLQ